MDFRKLSARRQARVRRPTPHKWTEAFLPCFGTRTRTEYLFFVALLDFRRRHRLRKGQRQRVAHPDRTALDRVRRASPDRSLAGFGRRTHAALGDCERSFRETARQRGRMGLLDTRAVVTNYPGRRHARLM